MSNNKQQTSVDSIIEFMKNNQYFIGDDLYEFLKQAKEMEKEQIIDSFDEGKSDGYKTAREWDEMILWSSAEQYYNETFGGNNE
jgi:hypothetical protein